MTCNAPDCGKDLAPSDRRISIPTLTIEWGHDDLRETWDKAYEFCSLGCLSDWASERAADHDGRVVKEGQS